MSFADIQAMKALKNASLTKAKLLQYSGMRRWLYAVSNAKKSGTQLNIVCGLDSLTAGAGGSSYIDYFRPKIQTVLGNGGLGFIGFNSSSASNEGCTFAIAGGGTQKTNSPFDSATLQKYDPNLWSVDYSTAPANATVIITDPNRIFTKANVWYLKQPSGGQFKFGDNSFTAGMGTIDTSNATNQIAYYTHTGTFPSQVNNGIRTATISSANPVHLIGADLKNGTTGVRVHRLAQGGTQTRQVAQLDGASYTTFLQGIGCDLYVLNAGMNDSGASITDTQYDTDIRNILTWVRNANPNCAILIVGCNDSDGVGGRNTFLDNYRKKLQLIVRDYEALYIEDRWTMGNYTTATANGLMLDGVHPNATANQKRADAIFNAIGGNYLANVDSLLLN